MKYKHRHDWTEKLADFAFVNPDNEKETGRIIVHWCKCGASRHFEWRSNKQKPSISITPPIHQ